MQANLVGVSLALGPNRACYLPFGHRAPGAEDLFGGADLVPGQIAVAPGARALLKPLLTAPAVMKIAQNVKFDWLVLAQHGIEVAPVQDTMLASYTLDAGVNGHGMDELSLKMLGHRPIPLGEVAGQGKSFIGFAKVPLDKAAEYSAEDADVTLRLWNGLQPRLVAEHMTTVYETLERPWPVVLARMERRGICVDRAILSRLSGEFAQDMARLEAEVQTLAGESFQSRLAQAIGRHFVRQIRPARRRRKPRPAPGRPRPACSTISPSGGNELAATNCWNGGRCRNCARPMPKPCRAIINPDHGRVHTSYAMAATSTGRLSSSEPNLQNIPVRNEAGRKIRRAFIAAPGHKLISADYSQIELRLLAHIADIPQLKQAFAEGQDIHAHHRVGDFRRAGRGHAGRNPAAGQGDQFRHRLRHFRLWPRQSARHFRARRRAPISAPISSGFPAFAPIWTRTKKLCREQGFVTTLFGRKCHYPRINASNASERAFNERAAINAPIQGAAADIIRRAMIRMDAALARARDCGQMLLQVHDELVFEAPDAEVEATIAVVREVMERRGAAGDRSFRAAAGGGAGGGQLGRGALNF